MATMERLLSVGIAPIMCKDGEFALLVRWDEVEEKVGAQVPGEEEIRWIAAACVWEFGEGALMERDAL